jgi:hypothetical protein
MTVSDKVSVGLSLLAVIVSFWGAIGRHVLDRALEALRSDLDRSTRHFQSHIDRTVYVHRVQFETEFRLLTDIWSKVSLVRRTMLAVRPIVSTAPPDQTDDQRREAFLKRRSAFTVAKNDLMAAVDDHSPFYSAGVFEPLDRLLHVAAAEALDLETDPNIFESDWYDRGKRHTDEMTEVVSQVSSAIRTRLERLAII